MRRSLSTVLLAARSGLKSALLALCLTASAQSYSIPWRTIDGGGGTSTGGLYSVTGGFWALPTAVQTTNAPTLTIVSAGAGHAQISWTPNTPGFVLQETWVLSPANWVNSASGTNNPVNVPVPGDKTFYRLFKP
jgi:hypothetical protein